MSERSFDDKYRKKDGRKRHGSGCCGYAVLGKIGEAVLEGHE